MMAYREYLMAFPAFMKKLWFLGFIVCVLIAGLAAYIAANFLLNQKMPSLPHMDKVTISKPMFSAEEIAAIAPHKALYKIEMVQKGSSSQVLNISGQMYFEWKPVCDDAWSTNHRFDLLYEYADSPQLRITSSFTTYESIKGENFDFNSRRRRDNEVYEELRGHANVGTNGGQALFSLPADLKFDLPAGTLFPMAQTLAVLRASHESKKFFKATVFDGSDDEGPVEVNTFIGGPVNALSRITPAPAIDNALVNGPARDVRLAFFPLNNSDPDSDYEMNMTLLDNGVISDMRVDYKDFSVTQKLIGLEPLKADACGSVRDPAKLP